MRISLASAAALAFAALAAGGACGSDESSQGDDAGPTDGAPPDHVRVPYDGLAPQEAGPRVPVRADLVTDRVDTMALMLAAGEMQTSGEPFASGFAGRVLSDYDRYYLPPDQYLVKVSNGQGFYEAFTDLFGFSTAVESYEYSKYHVNMIANQTGAGVSLVNGPLVAALGGATPRDKLRARMERLIAAAGTDVGGFATLPPPANNPLNDFGFGGLWPNLAAYKSFDPSMTPTQVISNQCTSVTGYGGLQQFARNAIPTYECEYNSLRLDDRVAQTEHVIGPGILGYTTWKEALWAIDFTGRLHDSNANPVNAVAPNDVAQVSKPGNQVLPTDPPPCPIQPCSASKNAQIACSCSGVYIGSTPLEGMWGVTMVDEMDNAGAWLLASLATSDGAKLGGFSQIGDAVAYDYGSPLVWFPSAIAVGEDGNAPYPGVASLAIQDATSRAVDLAALARGYSLFFGMTDARNAQVGQQLGLQIAFSGDPFAADDGLPDGESTAHDRALGVMRVAFVDLDRMHADPATGVIVDTATVGGGNVTRGTTASTTSLGHVVVGLRHVLMACNASVTQYGAPDPDESKDAQGILNAVAIHPPDADAGAPPGFSTRVRQVLVRQAAFVRDALTKSDGTVANGATIAGGQATPSTDATTLEAQAAAVRVLVEAFLLTRDPTLQDRARAVARKLLGAAFWSDGARMFRATAGGGDEITMTAERFAWLQQALRVTYETLSVQNDALLDRGVLEDRIARMHKLFLNGWDDLDGDQTVQKQGECLDARLQLGEQALTGEIGHDSNGQALSGGPDRDEDCVLNIAFARKGSVLAGAVKFHAP